MFKIGVGPSSSHTLGPWRAGQRFINELIDRSLLEKTQRLRIRLYGSLALTGKGHGTDFAVLLGLSGMDPVTSPLRVVQEIPQQISLSKVIKLNNQYQIPFHQETDLVFYFNEVLPFHPNGVIFEAFDLDTKQIYSATYYSVGGGFVVAEGELEATDSRQFDLPFPIQKAGDLRIYCLNNDRKIWQIVMENERHWKQDHAIKNGLLKIWSVMQNCVYLGCHKEGYLPGGLNVSRRASTICQGLPGMSDYQGQGIEEWQIHIKSLQCSFSETLKWIGCFAMAVNEENASFGRVVTAPTNGAAGVIPAVLFYYLYFSGEQVTENRIVQFLLTAGEIGSIFKKGATISAALGGCQAEIGVSSSMAAAALTEGLGGSIEQSLMAAEIAMEHHLGLTCDPVGGLVQVPCIERNSMGAIKAITAANIALESNPDHAKVFLDDVVDAMWETAQNMHSKYKETSRGGLAVRIPILNPEC